MADSLEDLDDYDLLEVDHNWDSDPTLELNRKRWVLQFPGGPAYLAKYIEKSQEKFSYHTLLDQQAIYGLLENFVENYQGRYTPFWLPSLDTRFTLFDSVEEGDFFLPVCKNDYSHVAGHRIYILTSTGDRITREIVAQTEEEDYCNLEISAIDRDLSPADIAFFGCLLFCRFDLDSLELSYITNDLAEADINFLELVNEYPGV